MYQALFGVLTDAIVSKNDNLPHPPSSEVSQSNKEETEAYLKNEIKVLLIWGRKVK